MNAPLHQDAGSSKLQGLFDFLVDYMVGQDVGFGVALYTVKRTKRAELFADVRVINIAVDDVTNDIIRMQALPDVIGRFAQVHQVRFFKQTDSLVGRDAFSIAD